MHTQSLTHTDAHTITHTHTITHSHTHRMTLTHTHAHTHARTHAHAHTHTHTHLAEAETRERDINQANVQPYQRGRPGLGENFLWIGNIAVHDYMGSRTRAATNWILDETPILGLCPPQVATTWFCTLCLQSCGWSYEKTNQSTNQQTSEELMIEFVKKRKNKETNKRKHEQIVKDVTGAEKQHKMIC